VRIYDFLHFLKQIFFPEWAKSVYTQEDSKPQKSHKPHKITLGSHSARLTFLLKRIKSHKSVGTFVSLLIHLFLFIVLSLIFVPIQLEDGIFNIIAMQGELLGETTDKDKNNNPEVEIQPPSDLPDSNEPEKTESPENVIEQETESAADIKEPVKPTDDSSDFPAELPSDNAPPQPAIDPRLIKLSQNRSGFQAGGDLSSRSKESRGRLFANDVAGQKGEAAIEAALEWLASHQNRRKGDQQEGGWSFDFGESCVMCRDSGTHGSKIAATGIAVLAFLGAGYTHEKSPGNKYQKVVEDGLLYLVTRVVDTNENGGALNIGNEGMYSHGIAAIALCEAAAMQKNSRSKLLRKKAQDVLRFIENAQDRVGGGWRYNPGEPGDISVTAWQVMALKSGKLANLHISGPVLYKVNEFLDSVEYNGGRAYNYLPINYALTISDQKRGTGADSVWTCNATGLLLRMYLSWEPGERVLDEGIEVIAKRGALYTANAGSTCNLYYAYYGTLLMHHYGEEYWAKWYGDLRDFLVKTQSKSGHESGSWYFKDNYADKGGRLLNTALGVLILETPYRYLPLYRK
jgi:hypothetical protein